MKFLYIEDIANPTAEAWAQQLTAAMQKTFRKENADDLTALRTEDGFSAWLQQEAIDLIFISCEADKRIVQAYLNACRALRIPYVFCLLSEVCEDGCAPSHPTASALTKVLAPVTMLEEEVHKGEILSHLMRFTGCEVTLVQAKDYGHKAERNTTRIRTWLQTSCPDRAVSVEMAQKDSLNLYKQMRDLQTDLLVWTASREYGLDDILFGPAERKVILYSGVPVMLLNPRDDLFSLCD